MRVHSGEGKLLRVFVDEDARYGGRPVYQALVEALRDAGFTGATVFKGIEGFGPSRTIRSTRISDYSTSLPVLIEIVDEERKIADFLPKLLDIVREGLVTIEHLTLIKLAAEAAS